MIGIIRNIHFLSEIKCIGWIFSTKLKEAEMGKNIQKVFWKLFIKFDYMKQVELNRLMDLLDDIKKLTQ